MNRQEKIDYLQEIAAGTRKPKQYEQVFIVYHETNEGQSFIDSCKFTRTINGKREHIERGKIGEVTEEWFNELVSLAEEPFIVHVVNSGKAIATSENEIVSDLPERFKG